MEIGAIINQRPVGPVGINEVNPVGTTVTPKVKLTKQEVLGCDIALSQYKDLMQPAFYKWYCKAFYQIGQDRFHILASQARAEGRNGGARLFSSLIKKELSQ